MKIRKVFLSILIMLTVVGYSLTNTKPKAVCPVNIQNTSGENELSYNRTDSSRVAGSTVVVKYSSKINSQNIMFDEKTTKNIGFIATAISDSIISNINRNINSVIELEKSNYDKRKTEAKAHRWIFSIIVLLWALLEGILVNADTAEFKWVMRAIGVISFILLMLFIGV